MGCTHTRVCVCACMVWLLLGKLRQRPGSIQALRRGVRRLSQHLSPTPGDPSPGPQVFVKCHFDYDPATDSLIPCKEAGLKFMAGDLLQIVNQDDPNWWQVRGLLRVVVVGGVVALSPLPWGCPCQLGSRKGRRSLGLGRVPGSWWGSLGAVGGGSLETRGFLGRSRGPWGWGDALGDGGEGP